MTLSTIKLTFPCLRNPHPPNDKRRAEGAQRSREQFQESHHQDVKTREGGGRATGSGKLTFSTFIFVEKFT